MIGSICHRELFVFSSWIDTRVVPGQRQNVTLLMKTTNSVTLNHWLFVIGDWHNASLMAPPHNVIDNTFWIFLPPSFFFRLSNVSTLWSIFSSNVASCETCCTSGDPVSVSELFCGLGHMWWMKVRLVCLVSLVSRVPRLLAPGSRASRCHRGGADSKQLMRRQPRRKKRIKR